MFPRKIFLDSDAVISALLSRRGAAYLVIHKTSVKKWISNFSQKEIKIVAKRLSITDEKLRPALKLLSVVALGDDPDKIKEKFERYVGDSNDVHVVAGAAAAKVGYLITYNLKHFRTDKIKFDFGMVVMTPGLFLQYLRSAAGTDKN